MGSGNKDVNGFTVPYKPGARILSGDTADADRAAGWELGYHATSAYSLYGQCYHGRFKESKGDQPGERACTAADGVYLYEKKNI